MAKSRQIRLDASTICQLKCPSCPTASGDTGKALGTGYLKIEDFKKLIDRNKDVSHIELSNWGEIFLNKDILKILKYAYKHNVRLAAANGANLNNVRPEVLEGLVKYRFKRMTCSLDGASQATYSKYRVNGDFNQVIKNIKQINKYKRKYRSAFPILKWQFIPFAHNEHEINKARAMAQDLEMEFSVKLSWGDLYTQDYAPIVNREAVRRDSGLNAADRDEYQKKNTENTFTRNCCLELWRSPQLNFDGRFLGCPVNYWGDYGNAFDRGLESIINGADVTYAKEMLLGNEPPKDGIPCSTCKIYTAMKDQNAWIAPHEAEPQYLNSRAFIMFENKVLGYKLTKRIAYFVYEMKRRCNIAKLIMQRKGKLRDVLSAFLPNIGITGDFLTSQATSFNVPMPIDAKVGWKTYPLVRGFSVGMEDFGAHVSTLAKGEIPHPPHHHKEEEILMMLKGTADLILPSIDGQNNDHVVPLNEGEFVYYPAHFVHTLQATSEEPANYLMFRWHANNDLRSHKLPYAHYKTNDKYSNDFQDGFTPQLLFEGKTDCLNKLHVHCSTLAPNAGYPPHPDPYDVALIVLEGEIETLGKRYGAHSVVFYSSGEPHGIHNPGDINAKYMVVEFHN